MILRRFIEPVAPILSERLGEAIDTAEGSAQVVRDRITERLELVVEERLFVHIPLQFAIERAQLPVATPQQQ
jgi:hypothetical protein